MDMGKQLDFNHELITVGISNFASGLAGGFTGSYIFSTTIFAYRTGEPSLLSLALDRIDLQHPAMVHVPPSHLSPPMPRPFQWHGNA
eukprot:scaffold154273_cov37-Tisochrysis_lutea.AAC.7